MHGLIVVFVQTADVRLRLTLFHASIRAAALEGGRLGSLNELAEEQVGSLLLEAEQFFKLFFVYEHRVVIRVVLLENSSQL